MGDLSVSDAGCNLKQGTRWQTDLDVAVESHGVDFFAVTALNVYVAVACSYCQVVGAGAWEVNDEVCSEVAVVYGL